MPVAQTKRNMGTHAVNRCSLCHESPTKTLRIMPFAKRKCINLFKPAIQESIRLKIVSNLMRIDFLVAGS